MEIRDGFIDGIFNYCDRWCETCAFTSWCRLFAESARHDAADDPSLKPLVETPPLPHEADPEPPRWMQELLAEVESAAMRPGNRDAEAASARHECEDHPLLRRVQAYSLNVHRWKAKQHEIDRLDPADPRAIIAWFGSLIPAKIARALSGRALPYAEDDDYPRDDDGSAKVALIGIERSHAAWLRLSELKRGGRTDVHGFIADLVWLGETLEQEFPAARSFVRPGFDEPEAVARLRASGG